MSPNLVLIIWSLFTLLPVQLVNAEPAMDASYKTRLNDIKLQQDRLKENYRSITPAAHSKKQLQDRLFDTIFNKIIPYWYGTPWSFSGSSTTPKIGSIACGYFVSTVLRDANFKVNRVKMAQQPSELIILSLVEESQIKRFRNKPIKLFVDTVRDWGKGIYVVGLDFHTGFIIHDGTQILFVHSSYLPPYKVVQEYAGESAALAESNYKVIGKLSTDQKLLNAWINEDPIITKTLH